MEEREGNGMIYQYLQKVNSSYEIKMVLNIWSKGTTICNAIAFPNSLHFAYRVTKA